MPKTPQQSPVAEPWNKTAYQTFEYREIPRSSILEAAYNPREISAYARKQLKKKLEEVGCVEPLIWNESTGHLVGGHQRLSILDELEGGKPYIIGVSVVRLTEKRERALNVFLNNKAAQGHFGREGLLAMLPEVELSDMGFNKIDFDMEIGALPEIDVLLTEQATPEALTDTAPVKKRGKDAVVLTGKDTDFYVVIAFDSAQKKAETMKLLGLRDDKKYFAAEEFLAALEPKGTRREVVN